MQAPPDSDPAWLAVTRGDAPLVVSVPHAGIEIPPDVERGLASGWLARKDTDWWVDRLYDFAGSLGATVIRTAVSRTVIDVNRDPSGASLYPGQATTDLCPLTTFDAESLWQPRRAPDAAEVDRRREAFFAPYHASVRAEVDRLRAVHPVVVLYDCHSIRSQVPRLFEGTLPHFSIGTNDGASADPGLARVVEAACTDQRFTRVTNGRFRGGYITRHYGRPADGVHAVQMELACRSYLEEPLGAVTADNWPAPYDPSRAAAVRTVLTNVLGGCVRWALGN